MWIEMNICGGLSEWSNIFQCSTVTWVSGLIAKYSPRNVRTKDTTNPSWYMSCKVIYIYSGSHGCYMPLLAPVDVWLTLATMGALPVLMMGH